MPKKNKAKPNGFYQFMKDQKINNPIFANVPITEMASKVDNLWKNLSQDEKKCYNALAKNLHDNKPVERYTSGGLNVAMLEKEQEDKEKEIQKMKDNINRLIESAIIRRQLPQEVFLIMHINSLVYYPQEEFWYICEIAVTPFSLSKGVLHDEIFHEFVKPGPLPLGYRASAREHSELTHKLESYVLETDEDTTQHVYSELLRFLNKFAKDGELPYVYVRDNYVDMARNVMDRFYDMYEFGTLFNIYTLEYMFFVLRNKVKPQTWPTDTFSYSAIDRDDFSHVPNLGCDYHEMADLSLHCSKSISTRYSYTICDHCCKDMGIQLVPGLHIPSSGGLTYQSGSVSVSADPEQFTTVGHKGAKSKRTGGAAAGSSSGAVGRNSGGGGDGSGSRRNRGESGGSGRMNYAHSTASDDYGFNASQLSQDDAYSVVSGVSQGTQSTYQDDYPALGASGKTQGKASKDSQNYARAASSRGSSLAGDFDELTFSDSRSDISNLRFPKKGSSNVSGRSRPYRQ